ncbi:ABC transporter permease [Streptomyces sp. NPDC004111]|uniref:ABC transporter permease n=1 Tax=Streptomyces sp. NPDC004111 TaxID=3364690 RepID=UPI0036901CE6
MTTLLLGLRLLWSGERKGRIRFLLMSLGCSLGVACLAAVLTIPAILAAHDGRSAARAPRAVPEVMHARSAADTLFATRQDPYGASPFTRILVARPAAGPAPVPPGLDRLPAPGEVYVSPRLREILAAEPGLAGLLPGRITATIGATGLAAPDELYAYLGQSRAQLPRDARPLASFGFSYSPSPAVDASTLDILRFTLACLVLLPLTVFLSVCARLSAESRARRLASLRLLGLSVKGTLRVNAVETVTAALIGAVLGIGAYFLVNEIMARVGLPGLQWYAADGRPSAVTLAVCLLACPALAWFVGRHHAREAALSPLSVRRSAQRKPPGKYGLVLLLPGLGIITGYCVLGALGRSSEGSADAVLVPAAVLLTGSGLVLALAPITSWLARRLAGRTQSLPLTLAMRRNEIEPGSSLRVVTGLVLLVFAASLTQGVLVELSQISRPTSPTQEYRLASDDIGAGQRARMAQVAGVRAQAVTADSWIPDLGSPAPRISAVVATCAQLAAFADVAPGCVDGKVLRLTDSHTSVDLDAHRGKSYPFLLEPSRPSGHAAKLPVVLPEDSLAFHARQPSALTSADVLVPPSLLPSGTRLADSDFLLVTSSEPAAVRTALDGIGALAPTADIEAIGVNVEALQQITVIKSLLASGMILGLVIGVAAFVVSVADRAMERRSQVTALALLGARPATLRTAQCVQVLLPLAIGLTAALIAGRLAESSYLITGGGDIFWDADGLPLLLASTLGVLVVAGLASLPLVRRHVDPEHIRRD